MRSSINRVTVILLAGSLLGAAASAQERLEPRSSFVVNFDFARFRNDDTTSYVELYVACFPQLVTLSRVGERYEGYVALVTRITSTTTGEDVVNNRSFMPVSAKDTGDVSYHQTLITQMGYVVPHGEYLLSVTAKDSLAPSRRDTLLLSLNTGGEKTQLSASDIELCSNIRQSQNTSDPFYKNLHEIVPNPTLLFGTANFPVIFHYLELYNLVPDETYIIKTIVADMSGKPLLEASKKRKYGIKNAVEVGTTNATKLESGKYRFQIFVLSSSSQPLVRTEKTVYAYNPQIKAPVVSDATMIETELSGLTAEELALEFHAAQYLASEQEIKTFSQITTAEGRRKFLAKFWSEAEKGKLGHAPIARRDYVERAKKANERFRAFTREGWRTDRGRVFLLFAEPDEIERRPSSEGGKPYEIWHYFQIENGVQFVFIDRTGFGDYVLVHSTKRGELRDDEWQRLL